MFRAGNFAFNSQVNSEFPESGAEIMQFQCTGLLKIMKVLLNNSDNIFQFID